MKKQISLVITLLLFLAVSACSVGANGQTLPLIGIENATAASNAATESVTEPKSTAEFHVENSATLSGTPDYQWDDSAVIPIIMDDLSITTQDESIQVDGSQATITSKGTYSLSGSLRDGQIIVDTQETGMVRIILNGAVIHNSSGAPIYIKNAEKAMIVLADNTENTLSDGTSYLLETGTDEPNATLFSKADLVIYGNGALVVQANYNDGIASKDGLLITSGTIAINATDDGIRGKDYLVVSGGNININAGGDGLKSDNADDAAKGFISIEGGSIQAVTAGDGLDAETNILISAGELNLTSGGGYAAQINSDVSAKGIKAKAAIHIEGGDLNINSADDAIHSNGSIIINQGILNLTTGDDGIHADSSLTINGGNIRIGQSYEGIESASIIINAGNLHIIAWDDGINVAGGMDGSGLTQGMPGGRPRPGGGTPPRMDGFAASSNYTLSINGGYIVIDADGDGIDVNGRIDMTDGVVIVNGPTQQMNGALDYDAAFNISGGFLVAVGSAGMAQAPDATSSQNSLLLNFSAVQTAGTLIHLRSSVGEELLTFEPPKQYQSIAFSSPQLNAGTNYQVFLGGSAAGESQDGLYAEGSGYTPGQQYTEITITSTVTRIGSSGGPRRP